MSSPPPPSGGYSLFPNPNSNPPTAWRPPSRTRRSESRERSRTRGATPNGASPVIGAQPHAIDTSSPPRAGRRTPQLQNHRTRPSQESTTSPQEVYHSPMDGGANSQAAIPTSRRVQTPVHVQDVQAHVQQPREASTVPGRSETAFSEAHTLVRSNSNRSRSSIAKLPLPDAASPSNAQETQPEVPLRSIFPQYNPTVPLNQQEYFPTQTSPTHIPRAVINRMTVYHPDDEYVGQDGGHMQSPDLGSSPVMGNHHLQQHYHQQQLASALPIHQQQSAQQQQQQQQQTHHAQSWPRRHQEMPPLPTESTTEQLKGLWKVLNGWRASPNEGKVFCMKLTQEKDTPIYTLSSKQQPFYRLRLDPTSAAANVTLTRHDPSKSCKASSNPTSAVSPSGNSSSSFFKDGVTASSSKASKNDHWQEVLSTTLEEESRRHRPQDGLVALLYPTAAAKVALDRPSDANAVATAESECARLVWDDDSTAFYLAHPAIATPFCVTIERNPAWSRVEYTLEHHESPQHIAKLTRDGTGQGWLEVDTTVAGRIESFFILDVAVSALLIVASGDERTAQVETFEPPPLPPALLAGSRSGSGMSVRSGGGAGEPNGGRNKKKATKKRSSFMSLGGKKGRGRSGRKGKMEEFEIDVESQDSGFAKFEQATKETRRKLPWPLRFTFKVLGGLFKCFIWTLTMAFKALAAILIGMARCLGLTSKGG